MSKTYFMFVTNIRLEMDGVKAVDTFKMFGVTMRWAKGLNIDCTGLKVLIV